MKQDKQQLTTGKRILRNLGWVLLGGLAGGIIGGMLGAGIITPSFFHQELETLLWGTRTVVLIVVLVYLYFIYQSRKHAKSLQTVGDDEEDLLESLDRLALKELEYATIFFNVASVFILFNLVSTINFIIGKDGASFTFSILDYGLGIALIPMQSLLMKTTQLVRNYKLSALPTVKEMKRYLDSMDEGEKQANYERSYEVVFNLNMRILPTLYIVVLLVEMVSQTKQTLALAIVLLIHLYINLSQIKMIRRYFK